MKMNLKRCISTIAVLSMTATIVSGFSMTASASGESVLITAVGDAKWVEVYNKKLIDVMTPDGPISPKWNMETSYGTWEVNPEAVKESFDVIDNNLVFGKAGGDTQVITTLTDSMVSGDFIIDVKCAMLEKLTSGTNNYWPLEFRFDGHCFHTNPNNTGMPLRVCFGPSKIYMSMSNMDYVNTYEKFRDSYPSGVSPTEKSDAPYNYCYLRLVVDNSLTYHKIRPYIKLNEADNWTATYIDDWTIASLKSLSSNNKIQIRAYDSRTIVDSVKIYKKISDIDGDYIVKDIAIEKKSEFEYTTKVNLANIGADIPAKICTQIYEIDGENQNYIGEIVDEYTGVFGQADTYKQNITVPQDGKAYILKAYVMYKDDIIKSMEYGDVSVLSSNITSNGKIMLGGAVSMIGDSSILFKNEETQEEIEGECLIEGNDAFLISKASLDEGVEYEIIVRGKSGTQSKTIDFAGSNVVKVLYNVDAKLTKSENSINYELENRLNEAATAEIFIVKYKGLKLCSLENETISLMANEKKQGLKSILLESDETAKVFVLNNLTDYVLISDAITVE